MTRPSTTVRGRAARGLTAACGALLLGLAVSSPAHAVTWVTDDTDNMAVSAPGSRAYTGAGSKILWRHEGGSQVYEDKNAHWYGKLALNGARGSCALFRVYTYKETSNTGAVSLSKRWPAAGSTTFGYYQRCSSTGKGNWSFEGGDTISNRAGYQYKFNKVVWTVCWTPNASTPPAPGNCSSLTRAPGD